MSQGFGFLAVRLLDAEPIPQQRSAYGAVFRALILDGLVVTPQLIAQVTLMRPGNYQKAGPGQAVRGCSDVDGMPETRPPRHR